MLPGLQGAADDGAQRFVIGPAWLKNGDAGLSFGIALKPEPESAEPLKFETSVETVQTPLPKGRWLRVNQEVVLNTPDASDGIVRLWIDGKLVADRIDVRMRSDKAVVFTGVSARAHMLGEPHSPPAQSDSSISLTPFELMW